MKFSDMSFLFRSGVNRKNSRKSRYYIRQNIDEALFLYNLASNSNGDIIEIGTKYGGSAILMSGAISEKNGNRKIYTIDNKKWPVDKAKKWAARERKLRQITPPVLLERINFIIGDSLSVASRWEEEVSLVFIDADHTAKAVKRDIKAWIPHLKIGGVIAFHDVVGPHGIKSMMCVINRALSSWIPIGSAGSIAAYKKNT